MTKFLKWTSIVTLALSSVLTVYADNTGVIEDDGRALRYEYDKSLSTPANNQLALFFLSRPDIWFKRELTNFIKNHKNKPLVPSSEFADKFNLVKRAIGSDEIMTISKKQRNNNRHVIILHGGGYVFAKRGIKYFEEDIELIMNNLGDRATYVDYPGTQTATYKEITKSAISSYKRLLQEYPNDEFVVFGNSAGGNLALLMAQKLKRDNVLPRPQKYILLSPWADISTDSPAMKKYDFYDTLLSISGGTYAADKFRNGLSTKDPRVSPLYGDFSNLADIAIFHGTYDILYPDSVRLYQKAKMSGLKVHLYEYNRLWHDWMLYNKVPEAYTAWKQAADFVK